MRFFRFLTLMAAGVCLVAQTPPKAPLQATPVAPSTPASLAHAGADGITVPLEINPAKVIPPERVVIQVGERKITSGQVDQILQAYPENQRVWFDGPGREQFIDQIIRVLLLSDEGKRRGLNETETYRTQLMYQSAGILAVQTDAEVKRQARGDEAALRAYYEAHKAEYDEVRVRHILIRMQGSPAPLPPGQKDLTEAEALAKAAEIRQKLVDGADFAELARTESIDATASKGGELGFLKRGQTVPSFEEAAMALSAGQISQPVKTIYGYHIIQAEERKPARTFEDLRPELEKIVENAASRKLVESLKANARIAIDPEFGAKPQPAATFKP